MEVAEGTDGDLEQAEWLLKKALKAQETVEALTQRARVLVKRQALKDARGLVERVKGKAGGYFPVWAILGEIELGTRASSGLRLQCRLGPGAHRLELRHLGLHGCLQSVQPLTCERHTGAHRATRALRERAGLKQLTPGALQALFSFRRGHRHARERGSKSGTAKQKPHSSLNAAIAAES